MSGVTRTAAAGLAVAGAVSACILTPASAHAAPETRIVQGEHIRIESTADWDRMSRLAPGEEIEWTLAVSADAPAFVDVGVRADGGLALEADVSTCEVAWEDGSCASGRTDVRTGWPVPRDGETSWLLATTADEVVHVRLVVAMADEDGAGATTVAVHVRGEGDDILLDGDDDPLVPSGAAFGAAPLLLAVGLGAGAVLSLLTGRRRKERS